MALPPPAMPPPGATPTPPPGMAAAPPEDTGSDPVVLTVTMGADGMFTLYAGDEPEEAEQGDMSEDDVAAMGSEGEGPAPQTADSLGEALKMAMDILKAAAQGAGGGSAEQQFAAGFTGGAAPMGGAPPGA